MTSFSRSFLVAFRGATFNQKSVYFRYLLVGEISIIFAFRMYSMTWLVTENLFFPFLFDVASRLSPFLVARFTKETGHNTVTC